MKKVVLNYLVIAALAVAAAFTSCKKDDERDRGLLEINGHQFPIAGAIMCVREPVDAPLTVSAISFEYIDGRSILSISMKDGVQKLTTKTYTADEIEILGIRARIVDGDIHSDYDYWDDNVEMKVDVKGKIYNITITGRATKNKDETDYTFTYKGKINEEDCF